MFSNSYMALTGAQQPKAGKCGRSSCEATYDVATNRFGGHCSELCRKIAVALRSCPAPAPSIMHQNSAGGLAEAKAANLGWLDIRAVKP